LLLGWARANHPSQLHYAWDLKHASSLDFAISETTRRAVALLDLEAVEHPHVFEPGCGIGGNVTQVAQMLPRAKVTGVSLVGSELDIGRAIARARRLQNTEFVQGNYLETPFPDAHFDGIFAIETLVYSPTAEKPALFRELFRILKAGRTFVCFEGFRMRDMANETERRRVQDVMDGWTLPLPCTPSEFQDAARGAGFELVGAHQATAHIYESARRIAAIATSVLKPLSWVARIPFASALVKPAGFQSPRQARLFIEACRSQLAIFDAGVAAYYVHVFRKPGPAMSPS
jgi:SAM-dependent methyltransferase